MDKKMEYIQIRVTTKEKEFINQKASAEGKSLTRFILEKVLPEKFEWEKRLESEIHS